MPNRFEWWRKLLLAVKGFEVILGLAIAGFGPKVVPFYFENVCQALWQQGEPPANTETLIRWIFAVLGGTISGSALAQAYIVAIPFKAKEKWAWQCLALALLIWCIPDTLASLRYGVWPNAIFNVFPILMVAVPLLMTRKDFGQR